MTTTTTAPQVIEHDHWTRPNAVTVALPGTDKAVTFDADAYCGEAVYLHDRDAHPYLGEVVGKLGAIVGHGQYAVTPRGTWTERSPRWEAALRMARVHLGEEAAPRIS